MPTWISDHERLTEKGSWVFNFAFLPFKIQVLYGKSVSPELRSVGRVPALNSLGPGQVLLSSGRIPVRHLVCIQLLFPKPPKFYTLILSLFFFPVWFPWKCRLLRKRKPGCTLHTGSMYYFWSQLSCEHVPKCQHEQVLKGKAKIQMEGVRPNCLLELHIQIGYRAPACHRQYKMHLGKHWSRQKAGYRIKQNHKYSFVASIKACLIGAWEIQRHDFTKV